MTSRTRTLLFAAPLVALLAVGIVAAWLLGFFTPEPDEVSLTETIAATQQDDAETDAAGEAEAEVVAPTSEPVESATETDSAASPTAAPEPIEEEPDPAAAANSSASGVDGTWTIVESDSTFAGYRATNATGEAVGRSRGVTGSMSFDGASLTAVDIIVDMTRLTSDSRIRDDHLGDQGVEWRTFPGATFTLAEVISVPDAITDGEEFQADAVGDLTIRDVTQSVTISLDAVFLNGQVLVVGSTPVSLDDFGAGISSVNDDATMEFSLVFEPAG